MKISVGHIVGEKYQIEALIGEGATGLVYCAKDTLLGKKVALKFLRPELTRNLNHRKRFLNEARIAIHFVHPSVIAVREVCEWRNTLYIVMDYHQGRTLKEIMANRILSVSEIFHLSRQLLECLQEAHNQGILHRDIKTSNLMVSEQTPPRLSILDFGLARWHSGSQKADSICGTLRYMSPEQLWGDPLDHRSDLYSAAVCIYEMITGKLPIEANSADELTCHLLQQKWVPPSRLNPNISTKIDKVLHKALSVDSDERYQRAEDFWSALSGSLKVRHQYLWRLAAIVLLVFIAVFISQKVMTYGEKQEQLEEHLERAQSALEQKKYQQAVSLAKKAHAMGKSSEAKKIIQKVLFAKTQEHLQKDDFKSAQIFFKSKEVPAELHQTIEEYLIFYQASKNISRYLKVKNYSSALKEIENFKGIVRHRQILLTQKKRIQIRLHLTLFHEACKKNDFFTARKWLQELSPYLDSQTKKQLLEKISSNKSLKEYQQALARGNYWQAIHLATPIAQEKPLWQTRLVAAKSLFELGLKKCSILSPRQRTILNRQVVKVEVLVPQKAFAQFLQINGTNIRQENGTWVAQAILSEGTSTISLSYKRNNYFFAISSVKVHVDTTPPTFTIDKTKLDPRQGKVIISGTARDNNQITAISFQNHQAQSIGNNFQKWQLSLPISLWKQEITVTVKDVAGGESKLKYKVPGESDAPKILIFSPKPNSSVYDPFVVVKGMVEDSSGIQEFKVAGKKVRLYNPKQSDWQVKVPIAEEKIAGNKMTIVVEAKDHWGNKNQASLTIQPQYLVWKSLRPIKVLRAHTEKIWGMAYGPAGRYLVNAANDGFVSIWDTFSLEPVFRASIPVGTSQTIVFSPAIQFSSTFLARFTKKPILEFLSHKNLGGHWRATYTELRDSGLGRLLRLVERHTTCIAMSPDSKHVAIGHSSGYLRVIDLEKQVYEFRGSVHNGEIKDVAYSSDGRFLATGGGDKITKLFDTQSFHNIHKFKGHTLAVTCLSFSQDNLLLATGSRDKSIRIWSVASGIPIARLKKHTARVETISFNPLYPVISSGSTDGRIVLWKPVFSLGK